MLSILIIIVILTTIFVQKYRVSYGYWAKRNVKQVNGILWRFIVDKKPLSEIYKETYEAYSKLPYVGTFFGMRPVILLRDVHNIEAVLHGNFKSFHNRGIIPNVVDRLADNILFSPSYKRWKLLRQRFSPVISKGNLKNLFSVAERCTRDFVDYIKDNPEVTKNPLEALTIYTTACTTSTIFGIDKETNTTMNTLFSKIAYESLHSDWKFNLKFAIFGISPKLFKLLNFKAFGDYENLVIQMIEDLIEKRRLVKRNRSDFIDFCLKLKEEGVLEDPVTGYKTDITLDLLAAQAFSYIIGAVDSSTFTLHYALLELSRNPKILKKVHDEIDEIFKMNDSFLTFEDIEKLKYTEQVINEVLRKYPPIGFLLRTCCKDTILPVGGGRVDKDTTVIVPVYAIHKDEKYFPNPELFDPERFSAENISKTIRYTFLPFGEGKRICIGLRFAYMEIKTCLAWLLREHTLKEQSYSRNHFDFTTVTLRDTKSRYEIIRRTSLC